MQELEGHYRMHLEEIIWLEQFVEKLEWKYGVETALPISARDMTPSERRSYARKKRR